MGSKYPVLKPQEIIKSLASFGFVYKSQKGSHVKYIKTEKGKPTKSVIIPMHNEVAKGTLKSILEQAGLTLDEFLMR
ncbi:MAG: type II toxin-antitoxin system HicA family toxin [Oscillospiraceae bacterium]|nr:type II toxin-antitoxin system HicA family toxin [Oscillospiraceae bacterium]